MEVSDQLKVTGQMVYPPGGREDEICSHAATAEPWKGTQLHRTRSAAGGRRALNGGLANNCLKMSHWRVSLPPISAEKVNCSWPEVRNWKEVDMNSHKSRSINT